MTKASPAGPDLIHIHYCSNLVRHRFPHVNREVLFQAVCGAVLDGGSSANVSLLAYMVSCKLREAYASGSSLGQIPPSAGLVTGAEMP